MNDNSLHLRTQAQLQSLVDIITEHCDFLTRNHHLSQEYVHNFEQHIEHTVTNFSTYAILQRATLTLQVDLPELAIAHPVTVPPGEPYRTSSSNLSPSPFTHRRARFTHYAVRKGRTCGIFNSWTECSAQVTGYSGSEFKGFNNLLAAQNYLQ
jgi:hypothetical protein